MKKLIFLLVIFVLLSGCSGAPISVPFLQTRAPQDSPKPTVTPFSLGPTSTPNLFVLNTLAPTTTPSTETSEDQAQVPTATDTPTPFPTFTSTIRPTITLEPLDASLYAPSLSLFSPIQRSTDALVWGYTCEGARSIRFTAQVMPARRLRFVTLWYRLQDKYSGRHTDWGGGAILSRNGQGAYFYNLDLSQIEHYRFYEDAWLQYQLIASTVTQTVLGRSAVSRTDVSLTHCEVLNP